MARLLAKYIFVLLAFAAYTAAPFVTAWSIREAVRNGDAAYLETAIDWPSVRETLKPSLSRLAVDIPEATAEPSLWQRIKAYVGEGAVGTAIDTSITPEGLPKLFAIRKAYRDYVSGQPEESKLPVLERMQRAWARVKRAEFTSVTDFEVDMADKWDESRIYLAKLELTGLGWKLKELRVKFLTTAEQGVQQLFDAQTSVVQ
jgi:Protein of unknown function (DUF2939)